MRLCRLNNEDTEIKISAIKTKANYFQFTVKDNGIGIPSEEQNKLFTNFFRAKNALKKKKIEADWDCIWQN